MSGIRFTILSMKWSSVVTERLCGCWSFALRLDTIGILYYHRTSQLRNFLCVRNVVTFIPSFTRSAMPKGKVFVVQQPKPNNAGWTPNLGPATLYGRIHYVFS